ncbi:MAG: hypothetical protein RL156_64 [Bacteroidota bacterium]
MRQHRDVRPKKSLSQNFLTDGAVAKRIADALQPLPGECVVEIGPGTGALTKHLVDQDTRLVCIEKDARAVEFLNREYAARTGDRFRIQEGDILETNFASMQSECPVGMSVIGNIPYAISSEILFLVFDQAEHLRSCVLMMQREVAKRLVAQPRTKDYGVLTLAAAMAAHVKILFDVKPGSFFPVPGVTSAVVRFEFRNQAPITASVKDIRGIIRSAFAQRRKTLRNALSGYAQTKYGVDIRSVDTPFLDKRAEELTLHDFDQLLRDIQSATT